MKSLFFPPGGKILLLCLVMLTVPRAQAQEPTSFPAQPGLEDYLGWARDHHPAVARATGRVTAMEHGAHQAGSLPNLRFGWGEMIVPVETRTGPQERIFSISQSFPWFGTLGLKESVAAARADAAAQEYRAQLNATHHEIRSVWFDLAYLQGEINIITDNLALARQAEASARSIYESGIGSFADVLAAQIDAELLASQLAGLTDRVKPVTTRLNLSAGLPAGQPVPTLSPFYLGNPPSQLPADNLLWSLLEENNPDLAARKLEQLSRRQDVELAGKSGYPELTLGVDYIMTGPARMEGVPDSGQDPVIARLGVSLPLWGGKVQARKKSSAGWLAAASAEVADTRQQLNARLEAVLYAWREAERNAHLYGQVLHASGRQALEVTSARYRSGQSSYIDLVTARKTLLGIELANLRAVTDQNHALNDLSRLLGMTPEELIAQGSEPGSG